ncbi:unnamed protein product [Candidula unifasciata]|uniref:Major facilitator superfamily (MFS) profile domain-containing protein n=1 Tax=Candidula unifasciata TaxID=100452 RepID=A0A8S3Z8G2_9EUPU|nr:unnamed protein product [Candidula unifasciata]
MITSFSEGLGRAEGLFFLQFQSKFGASAQLAAWPNSLLSTVRMFMGPACMAVVNRYSVRTASIIGTLLCFTGMLLNSFAPNVYFLFLSHTLLGGIGRGLMAGVVILNLYFDKHRSLANGLGLSGIGMGSLWTIPLVQYLFDEYGFTGTFMILSALLLHGLLIAMLYRPLRLHYQFMTAKLIQLLGDIVAASKEDVSGKSSSSSSSDDDADTFILNKEESTQSESNATGESVEIEKKDNSEGCLRSSLKICFPVEFKREGEKKTSDIYHWDLIKNIPFMIFCSNGLLYLLAVKIAFLFLPAIALSKGFSKQQAAIILTIIGGTDTFARIFTGFLMDLKPLRRYRQYFFTCLLYLLAADTLMIPILPSFTSVSIVCAIYGFLTGAFMAQRMVFLVDIVGREKVASALGIQRVFQGVGTLVGPPIAGALRDALGNYDSSFYLGGGSMLGSALLMTLCFVLLRIQHRKSSI